MHAWSHKQHPRVAVVVVTHNRHEMLRQVIEGLSKQTVSLLPPIIVDVASAPAVNLIQHDCSTIRLDQNLGGAAGFRVGMQSALRLKPDWIWVMDDDVVPDADALEQLLRAAVATNSRCLHPRKRYLDGTWMDWQGWLDVQTGRLRLTKDTAFAAGQTNVEVNYACFEGMLIHCSLVKHIGLPNPLYFLGLDDVEYGIRVAQHTSIQYVADACMTKLVDVRGAARLTGQYYALRNLRLLQRQLRQMRLLHPIKAEIFWWEQYLRLNWAALKVGTPRWQTFWAVQRAMIDATLGRFV